MSKHAGIPDPFPSPALADGIRRLADTLYLHVYGETLLDTDEQYANYMADAAELAELMPHLLSGGERGINLQIDAAAEGDQPAWTWPKNQ